MVLWLSGEIDQEEGVSELLPGEIEERNSGLDLVMSEVRASYIHEQHDSKDRWSRGRLATTWLP